jgi:predicted RNase H-related nuclease YkuK (DUF458 family)
MVKRKTKFIDIPLYEERKGRRVLVGYKRVKNNKNLFKEKAPEVKESKEQEKVVVHKIDINSLLTALNLANLWRLATRKDNQ